MNLQEQIQNVACENDGIELAFEGDRCGKSYRLKYDWQMKWYEPEFFNWRENGWIRINAPACRSRREALDLCNKHAVDLGLINFLPNRPKFKSRIGSVLGGLMGAAASELVF